MPIWNPEIECANREVIEKLQLHRLKKQLAHAYENSSYYRAAWQKIGIWPGDINELAGHEMVSRHFSANRHHGINRDAEFLKLALGFHLGGNKLATVSLGQTLDLGRAGTELHSRIAVLVSRLVGNHMNVVDFQHGHRNNCSLLRVNPGHAQLSCDDARTHRLLLEKPVRA